MKTKWRWMQLNLSVQTDLFCEKTSILDENFFHWFSKKPMSMILSPFLARWRRNEDECSWIRTDLFCQKTPFYENFFHWLSKNRSLLWREVESSSFSKHHPRWEFLSLVFQETNVDDSESISGKMKTKWRWMQLNLVTNRSLLSENIILDENFFHWFSKKPMSMILSPFLARWRLNEDECSWI